jgi:hypothetical protein
VVWCGAVTASRANEAADGSAGGGLCCQLVAPATNGIARAGTLAATGKHLLAEATRLCITVRLFCGPDPERQGVEGVQREG